MPLLLSSLPGGTVVGVGVDVGNGGYDGGDGGGGEIVDVDVAEQVGGRPEEGRGGDIFSVLR